MVSSTDQRGEETLYVYDKAGRMLKTINAEMEHSSYPEFDRAGRVFAQVGPDDSRTEFLYDDAGRTVLTSDEERFTTETQYDSAGRVQFVIADAGADGLNLTTEYQYDSLGRQLAVIDPKMQSTKSYYDLAGNMTKSVDAKEQATIYRYNKLGQRYEVIDRLQHPTVYGFDFAGRQASITDAQDGVTQYRYDDFGRLFETQAPDHVPGATAGQTGYAIVRLEYDDQGRMAVRTDQAGDQTVYQYDDFDRLENRQYIPAGQTLPTDVDTLTYFANGQIKTASGPSEIGAEHVAA